MGKCITSRPSSLDKRNASFADSSATLTITDDDTPNLSIADVAVTETFENWKSYRATLTLSHSIDQDVRVRVSTVD